MIHENQISQKTKEEWLEEGIILWKSQHYKEALEACTSACKLDPNCSRGYHGMGLILTQLKYYKKAYAAYERASQLDSNNAKITFDIGEFYFTLKDYRNAGLYYRRAIRLDQRYECLYLARVQSLIDSVLLRQLNKEEYSDKSVLMGFKNVQLLDPDNMQALSFITKSKENGMLPKRVIPYERPPIYEGSNYFKVSNGPHPCNCRCVDCWEP